MAEIVTRAQWMAARLALLEQEKAHSRAGDALAAQRRAMPWVRVDRDYAFADDPGPVGLAELFGDHSQLLVYHFMYGPDWDKPCPSCSFWADHFDGIRHHLARRDTALVVVSRAPLETLRTWQAKAGWGFRWVSSLGSTFNADFGVTLDGTQDFNYRPSTSTGEMPGLSVFTRSGDGVFHTYSAYARGLEPLNATYGALDLLPKGRDEAELPWTMAWVKRQAEEAGE